MRDYLASSRIAGWIQTAAGWLRNSGKDLARRMLKDPALLNLFAACKATPVRVAGVLMTTAAAANLTVLWLLERPVLREEVAWRLGFAILGILCITQGISGQQLREGSWLIRALDRLRPKQVRR